MSRSFWIALWLAAVGLVLAATVWPPSAIVSHPHWERVSWIPFTDDGADLWELAANVLLFAPVGYTGVRVLGAGRACVLLVVALGAGLSLGVETVQLFAHGRFPSTTDLVANTAGVALAAGLARWEQTRRERGAPPIGS